MSVFLLFGQVGESSGGHGASRQGKLPPALPHTCMGRVKTLPEIHDIIRSQLNNIISGGTPRLSSGGVCSKKWMDDLETVSAFMFGQGGEQGGTPGSSIKNTENCIFSARLVPELICVAKLVLVSYYYR